MTLPLWGNQEKAQEDNEKIEEAIARMIAEHNADSEAHLGSGQSLDAHKKEKVIDHGAGSVYADKYAMKELCFETEFEGLGGFITNGTVFQLWPGVQVNADGVGWANRGLVRPDFQSGGHQWKDNKEQLFEFAFMADLAADDRMVFMLMDDGASFEDLNGIGLEIKGLTARFFSADHVGDRIVTASFDSYVATEVFNIRLHRVPAEGVVKVYVNGEYLGSLQSFSLSGLSGVLESTFYVVADSASTGFFQLAKVTYAFGL